MCKVLNRMDWWSRLAKSRQTNIYNRYSRFSTPVIDLVVWSLSSSVLWQDADQVPPNTRQGPHVAALSALCVCVCVKMSEWETHFKHLKLKGTTRVQTIFIQRLLYLTVRLHVMYVECSVVWKISIYGRSFQIYLCVFDLTFHPFSADIFTLLTLFNFSVIKENSEHSLHLNIEKGGKKPNRSVAFCFLTCDFFCSIIKYLWEGRVNIKVIFEKWSQRQILFWKAPTPTHPPRRKKGNTTRRVRLIVQ